MRVRRAGNRDVDAIRALETEAFDLTWTPEVFSQQLAREDCLFLVGEEADQIVASLSLNWVLDEAQVLSVVVAPAFRGRGLSKQLLGEALDRCRERGLNWVHLEVKWNNEPAERLYRGFGFTTTGKRKNYYRDGQDARLMMAGPLSQRVNQVKS